MDPNNQGDNKEKETPNNPAPGEGEKKPTDTPTEFEKLKEQTQKEIEALKSRLAEKEIQSAQLTTEVQKLRQELRNPLLTEKKVENKKTDDDNFNEDEIDVKVDQKLAEKEKTNYVKMVNRCFDKFQKQEGVEFDAELDAIFRTKANKTHLGDSEDEIMETFQILFNGISTSLNRQQKKEDKNDNKKNPNIGDGGNEEVNRPRSSGINWLTKKLNRYEEKAAQQIGEKKYREIMQKETEVKTS